MVHAMDGGLASGDWPAMGVAELERLAPFAPGLSVPLQPTWISPRPFSAAARVHGATGEVFVKRHDPRVRDVSSLLEEHRFARHLRANGLEVPEVLPLLGTDGVATTAIELDGWTYEVHAPAAGIDLYAQAHSWTPVRCAGHAHALGQALAQLHRVSQDFLAPARQPRPLLPSFEIIGAQDLPAALNRFVVQRPVVARFLGLPGREASLRALQPWHAALRPLLAHLAPLWVHNDWHASNAFWTGTAEQAQVRSVIDFGLCNLGCAVVDLATALERNTIAWLELDPIGAGREGAPAPRGECAPDAHIARLPLALALLQGYESVRPLTAAERQALPLLLPLAHVEYALAEVDYFCGVVDNARNASLAFPAFLLGHVRWFEGSEGRAYLEAVRQALVTTVANNHVPRHAPKDIGAK
jgi:Ser/Thr protein kinase RdoA (MazF antagonist)